MKKKLTTEEDYRQRVDRVCMYIRDADLIRTAGAVPVNE